MGENICKHISEKGLVSRMHKDLLKFSNKKTNNPIKKWVKDLNRYFSKEGIQWPISTWKEAQHHQSSGKCKAKPLGWLEVKNSDNKKCEWACGEIRTLIHC